MTNKSHFLGHAVARTFGDLNNIMCGVHKRACSARSVFSDRMRQGRTAGCSTGYHILFEMFFKTLKRVNVSTVNTRRAYLCARIRRTELSITRRGHLPYGI